LDKPAEPTARMLNAAKRHYQSELSGEATVAKNATVKTKVECLGSSDVNGFRALRGRKKTGLTTDQLMVLLRD